MLRQAQDADSPNGSSEKFSEVTAHMLIPEENPIFLSILLKAGRRRLISIEDRDFKFSRELTGIMETEEIENTESGEKE